MDSKYSCYENEVIHNNDPIFKKIKHTFLLTMNGPPRRSQYMVNTGTGIKGWSHPLWSVILGFYQGHQPNHPLHVPFTWMFSLEPPIVHRQNASRFFFPPDRNHDWTYAELDPVQFAETARKCLGLELSPQQVCEFFVDEHHTSAAYAKYVTRHWYTILVNTTPGRLVATICCLFWCVAHRLAQV